MKTFLDNYFKRPKRKEEYSYENASITIIQTDNDNLFVHAIRRDSPKEAKIQQFDSNGGFFSFIVSLEDYSEEDILNALNEYDFKVPDNIIEEVFNQAQKEFNNKQTR